LRTKGPLSTSPVVVYVYRKQSKQKASSSKLHNVQGTARRIPNKTQPHQTPRRTSTACLPTELLRGICQPTLGDPLQALNGAPPSLLLVAGPQLKGRRRTPPTPALPPPLSRRKIEMPICGKPLQLPMVELQEPAVHGLGSRSHPRAWVARSLPPFLVFQKLFLQQPVTAPYQPLYGGQFKPSSVQIRAELV